MLALLRSWMKKTILFIPVNFQIMVLMKTPAIILPKAILQNLKLPGLIKSLLKITAILTLLK